MGAEISERARPRLVRVEAPRRELWIHYPFLVVAAPPVVDLAELAGVDHLLGEPVRRIEAVVEGGHVLHARRVDRLPDLVALVRVAAERLLADDVLARLRGCDRRLGMKGVRAPVVEEADALVGDDFVPVSCRVLVSVALGRFADGLFVSPRDRDESRDERRRPRHVRDLPERVRVGLPHERIAQHADADLVHWAIVRVGRRIAKGVQTWRRQ